MSLRVGFRKGEGLRLGWPARGTPEAEFPKSVAETAGGLPGKIGVPGGVPVPGDLPRDCRGSAGRLLFSAPYRREQSPGTPPGSAWAGPPALPRSTPPGTPIFPGSPPSSLRNTFGEFGLGGSSGWPAQSQGKGVVTVVRLGLGWGQAKEPASECACVCLPFSKLPFSFSPILIPSEGFEVIFVYLEEDMLVLCEVNLHSKRIAIRSKTINCLTFIVSTVS